MIKNIGMNLHVARIRAGIRRKEIADQLGVTSQTIINWETNIHKIPMIKAVEYCNHIGIELWEITGKPGEQK